LLAGTGAAVKASNLVPGAKASATAQDDTKADKKVKDKHACKGQELLQGQGRLRDRRQQDARVTPVTIIFNRLSFVRGLARLRWPSCFLLSRTTPEN
jgi:hypothetical protein